MGTRPSDVVLFGVGRAPRWVRRSAWAVVFAVTAAEAAGLAHLILTR